jgi:tetraacyldisaccharide 4'-kinase
MILRRILLAPFSLIWFLITESRNLFFNLGVLKSFQIPNKSICIGNLSVGGTGKTPMTAYLAKLYSKDLKVQILSRGYGRKTKGFRSVNSNETAENIGDEPLFYKLKFGEKVNVSVCEKREDGIEKIGLKNYELLLLDDAYQHRQVQPGFSILLTPFQQIFAEDFILPMGNLREGRKNASRSNCIVVTKCPDQLTENQINTIEKKLNRYKKPVFFSRLKYNDFVCFGKPIQEIKKVILVTGIANPNPLIEYLSKQFEVEVITYPDHHPFTQFEIEEIHGKIDIFAGNSTAIFTTEKDFARLNDKITDWKLEKHPWYYVPIEMEFENENSFKSLINSYVRAI